MLKSFSIRGTVNFAGAFEKHGENARIIQEIKMGLTDAMDADYDWSNARRKLLYKEVVCFFRGCSVDLQSFETVRKEQHLHQYIDRGMQMIALDRVVGSVGRYKDFGDNFLPKNPQLRDRWARVDTLMRQGKTPPIDVYQVGEVYYVLDGNHRVSVAKQRKLETIEAYVMEFTSPVQEEEGEDFNDALIRAERAAFVENAGSSNEELACEMHFTCPGCFKELSDQIEAYRQGYEDSWRLPMSYEEAFAAWHKEVYAPAVKAIRENDMLADFPERTEADLFIWTWQNNQTLEELAED
jgi:hypothetical protein